MRKGTPKQPTRHKKAKRTPGGLGGRGGRGGGRRKPQQRTATKTRLQMPKGVMKQSPEDIAAAAKEAAERGTAHSRGRTKQAPRSEAVHERGARGAAKRKAGAETPSPYRAAMTWLTQRAEEQSKTALPEQRTKLARAKDIVRSLFGMSQSSKGAGGVKGGAKQKNPTKPNRRR
jgi:hypothetical protein